MTYYFCLVVHSSLVITFDFCVLQNHVSPLSLRWPGHRVLRQEARARVCKRSACACGRFQNILHHIGGVDCTVHFSLDVCVCLFFVRVRGAANWLGLVLVGACLWPWARGWAWASLWTWAWPLPWAWAPAAPWAWTWASPWARAWASPCARSGPSTLCSVMAKLGLV